MATFLTELINEEAELKQFCNEYYQHIGKLEKRAEERPANFAEIFGKIPDKKIATK